MTQETAPIFPKPRFSLLPFFRCPKCSDGYWTRKGYRGHYALVHVLELA